MRRALLFSRVKAPCGTCLPAGRRLPLVGIRRAEAHLEDQRPDLDLVAVEETALALQEGAVDEGAVAAAEVAQERPVCGDAQQAVLARDPVAVGPDMAFRAAAEDIFAAGDRVAARLTLSGTHQSQMMGRPPTGNKMSIGGIVIFRVAGGKLAERWGQLDAMALMQQIGAVPAPGQ